MLKMIDWAMLALFCLEFCSNIFHHKETDGYVEDKYCILPCFLSLLVAMFFLTKNVEVKCRAMLSLSSRTLVAMSFLTNLGPYFNFLSAKILGVMSFSHKEYWSRILSTTFIAFQNFIGNTFPHKRDWWQCWRQSWNMLSLSSLNCYSNVLP